MPTTSECIATYLRAKDENRPHLMKFAFAETATLETIVETTAISFPPVTSGRNKIAQVLVRDFVNTYENIYTFCFADSPPKGKTGNYTCRWLVGMSEKTSGSVRVGCGVIPNKRALSRGQARNYHQGDGSTAIRLS